MAILSNSWAQHLRSQAGGEEANKNMKAFTEAFAPTTTLAERVTALVEEIDAAALLAGPDGAVLRTHSWTKFGGTRSRANTTVACLIGTGPRANVVIVDCNRVDRHDPGRDRHRRLFDSPRPRRLSHQSDGNDDNTSACCGEPGRDADTSCHSATNANDKDHPK